jgi:catechol 2,3-dioxygenase-like lactoylglutathione lyase family enzyme
MQVAMEVTSFDHVALWVAERDALAELLTGAVGMHEIERTERFTLVGGDARQGKVTLFDADGARARGVLDSIVLRVPQVDEVRARLEVAGHTATNGEGRLRIQAPAGVPLEVVESDTAFADLDHVVLCVPDPAATAAGLGDLGLEADGDRMRIAGREVVLRRGDGGEPDRPLLNHLAFLVDDAGAVEEEARARGIEIDDVVDAPNTIAVFLRGPDRIRLEYVEHKPGFALR